MGNIMGYPTGPRDMSYRCLPTGHPSLVHRTCIFCSNFAACGSRWLKPRAIHIGRELNKDYVFSASDGMNATFKLIGIYEYILFLISYLRNRILVFTDSLVTENILIEVIVKIQSLTHLPTIQIIDFSNWKIVIRGKIIIKKRTW